MKHIILLFTLFFALSLSALGFSQGTYRALAEFPIKEHTKFIQIVDEDTAIIYEPERKLKKGEDPTSAKIGRVEKKVKIKSIPEYYKQAYARQKDSVKRGNGLYAIRKLIEI